MQKCAEHHLRERQIEAATLRIPTRGDTSVLTSLSSVDSCCLKVIDSLIKPETNQEKQRWRDAKERERLGVGNTRPDLFVLEEPGLYLRGPKGRGCALSCSSSVFKRPNDGKDGKRDSRSGLGMLHPTPSLFVSRGSWNLLEPVLPTGLLPTLVAHVDSTLGWAERKPRRGELLEQTEQKPPPGVVLVLVADKPLPLRNPRRSFR